MVSSAVARLSLGYGRLPGSLDMLTTTAAFERRSNGSIALVTVDGEHLRRACACSGAAVSGMDAGSEILPGGQPAEQIVQHGALAGREPLGHGVLVRRAEAAEFLHERSAVPGQVERIVPAVGRVPASFDQPTFFEPIHQQYEPAGRNS